MNRNLEQLLSDDRDRSNTNKLRLLAIGSREVVSQTIHTLHHLKFADAGAWSPLLPGRSPGEVMSILTRDRSQ